MRAESAGYRARLDGDGLRSPITAEVWSTLPVLTKSDFRRAPDSWHGQQAQSDGVTWTWTSGSTTEPFKFPVSRASRVAETIALELNLLAIGWNSGMRRATIKAEPKSPRGLSKLSRALRGLHELDFPAADFRMQHVPAMVDRIRAARISYLRGYSTSIFLFAQEVLRRRLECTIPLITTLGEALSPKQAEAVERAFNGKVYRDYGGSEAMHIGFECEEHNGYHVDLARFHVEIIRNGHPAPAGEHGDIVVTAFRNDAMPLVRYSIGDLGSWAVDDGPCPCGNRFPRIAEVLGRAADFVVTSQGHVVNVPLLQMVFEPAQEHVEQYQVQQKDRDRFDVLWVARHDRAAEHLPGLQQQLRALSGNAASFSWTQVAEIRPATSGKRRILVPLR
jgi:phenylacetate-CoA ligase